MGIILALIILVNDGVCVYALLNECMSKTNYDFIICLLCIKGWESQEFGCCVHVPSDMHSYIFIVCADLQ